MGGNAIMPPCLWRHYNDRKKMNGIPTPPRLSMEAYAEFVGENWRDGNIDQMRRQKEMEERIDKPFRISECQQSLVAGAVLSQRGDTLSAMRKSHCAALSFAQELKRLRSMSVEERIVEALGMGQRFAWLSPVNKGK